MNHYQKKISSKLII